MADDTTLIRPASSTRTDSGPAPAPTATVLPPAPLPARPRPTPRSRVERRVKRALWAVLALTLIVAVGWNLRPEAVAVETAAVRRGTLVVTVDEDGRTRVKDRYVVSAPLGGTLARITLHPGDSVSQGAVVARLVPVPAPMLDPRARSEAQARIAAARAGLSQAEVAIARAEAAYGFVRREAERQRTLIGAGATAQSTLEEAELAERMRREELASAAYGRRVAASELRMAEAALARLAGNSREEFPVRAPARGEVLRVLQESEGVVEPGTPLLEVGERDALEVVVDVLTTDAVGIRPGAPVRIERWGGDSTLAGHVNRVEPSAFTRISALGVEEQRVNVVIALDGPGAGAVLGDGYRVEASIVVWEGRNRLLVPGGAVFRQGDGWATYVNDRGRARLRVIRPGRRSASEVEVLDGLKPGEQVVLYPTDNVADGVRVAQR
ncbi:MAG TPA: HlyD family efflux transporter periplasmic adaptor subunit [Gemmatimonadales bacterium]|nr:HlyD family efflux transporter periplasmic adaptor subunit [Gemmatimonadales bacterium]